MLGARRLHRRGHQPEIPARVVRANIEAPIAMIDVVLDLVAARRDQRPRTQRLIRREKLILRRRVARALQDHVAVVARPPRADVEALVRLFVHQRVFCVRPPQLVPVQLELPLLLLILHRVEQRAVVCRPYHRAHPLHAFAQQLARPQILHAQRVLAKAAIVHGVRQQMRVVRDRHRAQRQERLALSQRVQVQHNLFLARRSVSGPSLAAIRLVLLALFRAHVVPVLAIPERDRDVRLLDVAQHLRVELLL